LLGSFQTTRQGHGASTAACSRNQPFLSFGGKEFVETVLGPAPAVRFELRMALTFAVTVEPLLIRRSQVGQTHASNKADPQLDVRPITLQSSSCRFTGTGLERNPSGGETRLGNGLDGTGLRHLFSPSASLIPVSASKLSGLIRPWAQDAARKANGTDAVVGLLLAAPGPLQGQRPIQAL